jgi:hypothetical protein
MFAPQTRPGLSLACRDAGSASSVLWEAHGRPNIDLPWTVNFGMRVAAGERPDGFDPNAFRYSANPANDLLFLPVDPAARPPHYLNSSSHRRGNEQGQHRGPGASAPQRMSRNADVPEEPGLPAPPEFMASPVLPQARTERSVLPVLPEFLRSPSPEPDA